MSEQREAEARGAGAARDGSRRVPASQREALLLRDWTTRDALHAEGVCFRKAATGR